MDCLEDEAVIKIHHKDYKRYICPFCKRVMLTIKPGVHFRYTYDKMKCHVQSCKRYQAAIANGKARRDSIKYYIVTYSVK